MLLTWCALLVNTVQCIVFMYELPSASWVLKAFVGLINPLTSSWPHLRCDVGLEEGEYN